MSDPRFSNGVPVMACPKIPCKRSGKVATWSASRRSAVNAMWDQLPPTRKPSHRQKSGLPVGRTDKLSEVCNHRTSCHSDDREESVLFSLYFAALLRTICTGPSKPEGISGEFAL